jgi:acyl carrier protein
MASEEAVLALIYNALDMLNEEREEQNQIPVGPDTLLFGKDSSLDSLSLVSVIVDIELEVSDEFDQVVSLSDDHAMSRDPAPFTSVQTLKDYILEVLD